MAKNPDFPPSPYKPTPEEEQNIDDRSIYHNPETPQAVKDHIENAVPDLVRERESVPQVWDSGPTTGVPSADATPVEKRTYLRDLIGKFGKKDDASPVPVPENDLRNSPNPRITASEKLGAESVTVATLQNPEVAPAPVRLSPEEREVVGPPTLDQMKLLNTMEAFRFARNAKLTQQAEKLGAENFFRKMGTKYNKLNWKTKIAVGLGLGAGAAVFSGVSMPVAAVFSGGLALQRAAGMLGMYVKLDDLLERNLPPETKLQRLSNKALAGTSAVLYSLVMSAAIAEGVHLASESAAGEAVHEWLKSHWPFGSSAQGPQLRGSVLTDTAPAQSAPSSAPAAAAAPLSGDPPMNPVVSLDEFLKDVKLDVPYEPHAVDAPSPTESLAGSTPASVIEPAATINTPEALSVVAKGGDGGIKLFEHLQEAIRNAPGFDANNLSAAQEHILNGEPEKLAEEYGFYKPGAALESARVQIGSSLGFDAKGELLFTAPGGSAEVLSPTQGYEGAFISTEPEAVSIASPQEVTPAPAASVEPEVQAAAPAVPAEPAPAEVPKPAAPEITAPEPQLEPLVDQGYIESHITPQPLVEDSIVPNAAHEPITNRFGLMVSPNEAHIYADEGAKHLVVFGNSPQEQVKLVNDFFANPENATKVLYGTDPSGKFRLPYFLDINGKLTVGPPVRTSGFLGLGFFTDWMKPPGVEELKSIIK